MSKLEQIQTEKWRINRSLNEARHKIDVESKPGKILDKQLTPLYKQYGFFEERQGMLDLNITIIPEKQTNFFAKQNIDEMFKSLGFNLDLIYNKRWEDKNLPLEQIHELTSLYLKASDALADTKKHFIDRYSSNNFAFNIFGRLHWVTDFYNYLQDFEVADESNKKEIANHLQELMYYKPKRINSNILETSKKFNINKQLVIESFKEIIGVEPKDYSKDILDEAFGDYFKQHLPGQKGAIAKARIADEKGAKYLLDNWYKASKGDFKMNTKQFLKNYLLNTVSDAAHPNFSEESVTPLFKKFDNSFTLSKGQLNNFFNDLSKLTKNNNIHYNGDATKPVLYDYIIRTVPNINKKSLSNLFSKYSNSFILPNNQLNNFFLSANQIYSQNSLMNPPKNYVADAAIAELTQRGYAERDATLVVNDILRSMGGKSNNINQLVRLANKQLAFKKSSTVHAPAAPTTTKTPNTNTPAAASNTTQHLRDAILAISPNQRGEEMDKALALLDTADLQKIFKNLVDRMSGKKNL